MILAIDCGNSAAKLALYPDKLASLCNPETRPLAQSRLDNAGLLWTDALTELRFMLTHAEHLGARPSELHVSLCTARPATAEAFERAARELWLDCAFMAPGTAALPTAYAPGLGPDRAVAALAASRLWPGQNCILLSAGTALTVDAVSAGGCYLGGAIAPGPRAWITGLANAAPALRPALSSLSQGHPSRSRSKASTPQAPSGPGLSTAECLSLGLSAGFPALAAGLAEELARRAFGPSQDKGYHTILTGGGLELLAQSPALAHADRQPDLVCRGAALALALTHSHHHKDALPCV